MKALYTKVPFKRCVARTSHVGVISWGLRGPEPTLLKLLIFFYWLSLSKYIDLAFKVFCIAMDDFALLHGYWDTSNC